ncbi:MAG: universal stress protein [Isosphaeraceae bacterium]
MFPIKTILLPTDFSTGSQQAFSLASDLALARGARLIALHVVEPPLYFGEYNTSTPPSQIFRDNLDEWLKRCRGCGEMPALESRVVEGFASEAILRVAEDCRCDLIAMGSEGKSGIGRTLLGSVAERVAREASCPVLICRQPAETEGAPASQTRQPPFSTILFPADLSDRAREAFAVASALAGPGSRLVVQHVVTAADHASPEARSTFLKLLHELYPADSVPSMVYRLSGGEPVEEIRRAAEDTHCDLIVMSSHGRKGVRRLLMGSVAEEVLRTAQVPIVIVHAAKPETTFVPETVGIALA